jgi:hypothetical protein
VIALKMSDNVFVDPNNRQWYTNDWSYVYTLVAGWVSIASGRQGAGAGERTAAGAKGGGRNKRETERALMNELSPESMSRVSY